MGRKADINNGETLMNIDSLQANAALTVVNRARKDSQVINPVDIKAILYLGLRGDVSLPAPEHKVDILT